MSFLDNAVAAAAAGPLLAMDIAGAPQGKDPYEQVIMTSDDAGGPSTAPATVAAAAAKSEAVECTPSMTFEECELAILRAAVDRNRGAAAAAAEGGLHLGGEIQKIIAVVESFLVRKKRICYGGTAINNILPRAAQFYDRATTIPDYDFYSTDALNDAKELADLYYRHGYRDVEAKSGMHFGTFNVFVNFIKVADITFLDERLYRNLFKESIRVAGIHYASPNWLRMAMYLELCRPLGDTTRWEKVLTRLTLLNKYYPMTFPFKECQTPGFQRRMTLYGPQSPQTELIYKMTRAALIHEDVVFFGGYALNVYSAYLRSRAKRRMLHQRFPDFDVLSTDANRTSMVVVEQLRRAGFPGATFLRHKAIGEIVPYHTEIRIVSPTGFDAVAFVYQPTECVNYNVIEILESSLWMGEYHRRKEIVRIKIATIDTILRFYMAFMFTGLPYFNTSRLLCASHLLFSVQENNRLEQKGVLRRFTMNCIGSQPTREDLRAEKAAAYRRFKMIPKKSMQQDETLAKEAAEYEKWFLKYLPEEIEIQKKNNKTNKKNKKDKKNNNKKNTKIKKAKRVTRKRPRDR